MTLNELYDIATENDITVVWHPLHPIKAISVLMPSGCYIGLSTDYVITRLIEKECMAHELGHCLNRAFYTKNSSITIRRKKEHIANKWAVENLVPFNEFHEALKNGIVEKWELAEYFDVSEPFIENVYSFYKDRLMKYNDIA